MLRLIHCTKERNEVTELCVAPPISNPDIVRLPNSLRKRREYIYIYLKPCTKHLSPAIACLEEATEFVKLLSNPLSIPITVSKEISSVRLLVCKPCPNEPKVTTKAFRGQEVISRHITPRALERNRICTLPRVFIEMYPYTRKGALKALTF